MLALQNSIIGGAGGDMLGAPFETHNTKDYNFKLFAWDCHYTDDTILTIAIADWLASGGSVISYLDVYGNKYNSGFSTKFSEWLKLQKKEPLGSKGDGSAMRAGPIAYYASSLDEALALAKISAECTHDSEQGIMGAEAVTHINWFIKKGIMKENMLDGLKCLYPDWNWDLNYKSLNKENNWSALNEDVIPQAFTCFYESTDYIDTIRKAISIGSDSDTIASIAGTFAGAYYGVPAQYAIEIEKKTTKRIFTSN